MTLSIFSVLVIYLAGFITFLTINHLWLAVIGENFYKDKLRAHTIIKKSRLVPYVPAVLFLLCVVIVWVLVLTLTLVSTYYNAFMYGSLLGFVLYSFHNLFNLTLLKEHSWKLAIVDTIYGTVVLGVVSTIMFLVKNMITL